MCRTHHQPRSTTVVRNETTHPPPPRNSRRIGSEGMNIRDTSTARTGQYDTRYAEVDTNTAGFVAIRVRGCEWVQTDKSKYVYSSVGRRREQVDKKYEGVEKTERVASSWKAVIVVVIDLMLEGELYFEMKVGRISSILRQYSRKARDFQLPCNATTSGGVPLSRSSVVPPIRKEWPVRVSR